MKTKIIYECEICGKTSEDRNEIRSCEATHSTEQENHLDQSKRFRVIQTIKRILKCVCTALVITITLFLSITALCYAGAYLICFVGGSLCFVFEKLGFDPIFAQIFLIIFLLIFSCLYFDRGGKENNFSKKECSNGNNDKTKNDRSCE